MDHHLCSSRKDEYLVIDPNKEDGHEIPSSSQEEPPLFLDFPSPFFDDISTIPILSNNHTHRHHHSSPNKPFNISEPSPSETKPLKKRSAGKKDRHSKIHTAQGLRDRRMRLSLNIAQKFFDLQDLLGFDKASKTIEWLFCKSNKAIKEVAENFNPDHTNQHMNEEIERMDSFFSECTNEPENLKEMEIKNKESRKRIQNKSATRETRDQARARARQRTRERLMINELEKSKFLFEGNPKDDTYKLGLGYLVSPDNQNIDEVGYKSSPSEPVQQETWSPSLEHSTTHHLLRELQLANINADSFENYTECINVGAPITSCNTLFNHNPPAGWLNSSHGFLGIPGGLDADNFITESSNYAIVPNAPLTGDTYEQNPSSFFM